MVAARKPVKGDLLRSKAILGFPVLPGWTGVYDRDDGDYMHVQCREPAINGMHAEANWALLYVAEVTVEPKDPTWTP